MNGRPVLFVHGLWVHSAAWQPWVAPYEAAGYTPVIAGWPGDSDTVAATRTAADCVAGHGVNDIVDHYAALIGGLPERPIVVGHSFGGLIAQRLLDVGLASHAVAIDPASIKGVTKVTLAQIRTGLPVLSKKSNRDKAISLTARQFRFGFGNAISAQESRELFERYTIPGPGRPLFEVTSARKDPESPVAVDVTNGRRGPLLIIGGGKDHTAPEVTTRRAHALYAKSPAVTDYHVFPDRGHSLVFDHGWRAVADYTIDWLARQN